MGGVKGGQVFESHPVAAADDFAGNVVSAFPDTGGYAFDGLLGCRQPEVEQRHEVAFGMGLFDDRT